MAKVLTTASQVLCGPAGPPASPVHGGAVTVQSTAKLTVAGNPVLVKSGVGPTVSGCKTPVTPGGNKPCTAVSSVTTGEATKLQAGGQPVMLDTLGGTTDGNPVGPLGADASQDKLTAS